MTTTRTLCTLLAEALDALTPIERRVLAKAAQEDHSRSAWFARLLDGLVFQARADEIRHEQETAAVLAPFEAENLRELDEIEARQFGPLPQRTEGAEWWPED